MKKKSERGIALILSIGIVALLAILGVTFVIDMRLEQNAARNYTDIIKAGYLTKAGIDVSTASAKKYASDQPYDDPNDRWRCGFYSDEVRLDNGDAQPPYETFSNALPCLNMNSVSPSWASNSLSGKIVKIINASKQASVAGERIYKIDSNTANSLSFASALSPVGKEGDILAFPIHLEGVVVSTPANGSDTLNCKNINGEFPSWNVSSLDGFTLKFTSGKATVKTFTINNSGAGNGGNTLTSTSIDFGSTGQNIKVNDEFVIILPAIPLVSVERWQTRVIDCARQIYVNDRSSNIGKILDNLGIAIGSPLPTDIGTSSTYGIITKRPPDGYLTKEDIRYMLRRHSSTIAVGEERYNAIKNYISTFAYTDILVSMECGGGGTVSYGGTSLTDTSKNWNTNAWNGSNVIAYDNTDTDPIITNRYRMGNISSNTGTVLTVGSWTKFDGVTAATPPASSQYAIIASNPRSPVNINTANKEVLYAVLTGLSDGSNTISGEAGPGPIERSNAAAGNDTEAEKIASAIISDPDYGRGKGSSGIKTWKEFYDLIDHCSGVLTGATAHTDVTGTGVGINHSHSYITTAEASVIKANFNPNTRWIGWNKNASQLSSGYAPLSKLDLSYNTTEFCFNSGGYYEIVSTGVIDDGAGNRVAEKKILANVKIFDIWRQTAQADFEQRNTGETEAQHVARISNVQTYPEFGGENTAANSAGKASAVTFDGQMMLATSQLSSDANTTFRAGFSQIADAAHVNNTNDDLNANTSNSATPGPATTYEAGGTTNSVDPIGGVSSVSVISAPDRADIFPDGAYISGSGASGENLYYPLSGTTNFPAASTDEGTLEMWVKPNYDSSGTSGVHYFFSFQDTVPPTLPTEYVRLFDDNGTLRFRVKDSAYALLEATSTITGWGANEWHHIAVTWNWDNSDPLDDGTGLTVINLFVDGVGPTTGTAVGPAPMIYNVTPLLTNMYIGSDANAPDTANWANATIDEVRISNNLRYTVDFSASLPDRYYDKGESDFLTDPAYFTSVTFPDTAFPTSVTWGTITWTGYTPSGYSPADGIAFDIQTIGGTSPRAFPALSSAPDFTSASGSNRINGITGVSPSTQIQYSARFSGTAIPSLKDTPILDDVTITYFRPFQFLYWRELGEGE